jgi:hypothetical protein
MTRSGPVGGLGGGAAGPAGLAVLGGERGQVVGVDQTKATSRDRRQLALADQSPEHDPGYPELARRLRDRQQPSLLHADKRSQSASSVTGYTRCWYGAKIAILTTDVTSKEAPTVHPFRRAAGP